LSGLLSEDRKADLKKWLWGQQLADVLHEFPVALSATELVGMLKRCSAVVLDRIEPKSASRRDTSDRFRGPV